MSNVFIISFDVYLCLDGNCLARGRLQCELCYVYFIFLLHVSVRLNFDTTLCSFIYIYYSPRKNKHTNFCITTSVPRFTCILRNTANIPRIQLYHMLIKSAINPQISQWCCFEARQDIIKANFVFLLAVGQLTLQFAGLRDESGVSE